MEWWELNPRSLLTFSCLFELLRTGGSQSFMRGLWALFRAGLPVGHAYSDASCSKTETLTIIGQTLYPRSIRRVIEWVRAGCPFSVVFYQEVARVLCFVVFWVGKSRSQICILS